MEKIHLIYEDYIEEIIKDVNYHVFFDYLGDFIEKITSYRNEPIYIFIDENHQDPNIIKLFLIGKESKRYANIEIKDLKIIGQSKFQVKVDELDKAEISDFIIEIDNNHTFIELIALYNTDTGITFQYKDQ